MPTSDVSTTVKQEDMTKNKTHATTAIPKKYLTNFESIFTVPFIAVLDSILSFFKKLCKNTLNFSILQCTFALFWNLKLCFMKRLSVFLFFLSVFTFFLSAEDVTIDRQDCQVIKGDKTYPLYGKVKIVEYGEDFKVELVEYGEDLDVKVVEYGADDCGEVKLVEYGQDVKVRVVEYNADLKVKIVKYSPGLK